MSDAEQNARPENYDEGWKRNERRDAKRGVTAGKWINILVLILVLVAVGYLAYGAAAAYFPRRWADEVGAVVDGSRTRAITYGFGVGAVFTFVPLLVFAQIRRKFFNWTWRLIIALLAIVLALPNWLTMAVAIGTSTAAVDGRITMTTEAPGFRNGSAAGAIAGLILGIVVVATSMRLGHQRKKVRELKGRVAEWERRDGVEPAPKGRWRRGKNATPAPTSTTQADTSTPDEPKDPDGSEDERLAHPTDHGTKTT